MPQKKGTYYLQARILPGNNQAPKRVFDIASPKSAWRRISWRGKKGEDKAKLSEKERGRLDQ